MRTWRVTDVPMLELLNKTIGIIGFGKIGREVAKIVSGFGMKVIAYDTDPEHREAEGVEFVDLDELYRRSDVVTLHCPLNKETARMINKESLAKMKDGVILINNTRGGLVDEDALNEALISGKVYAAGLDVMLDEPVNENHPLLNRDNCYVTPRVSWAPIETRQRLLDGVVENLRNFVSGHPTNVVNE